MVEKNQWWTSQLKQNKYYYPESNLCKSGLHFIWYDQMVSGLQDDTMLLTPLAIDRVVCWAISCWK
jgi:hypothetical protein